MEEQRPSGCAERQVAKLVEDDEVGIGEPPSDLPGLSLKLFLFEGVDEIDRREESDALAVVFDSLDADGCGEMGLACARSANEHDIVGGFDEVTAVELPDQGFIDLAAGEVEAGQVAIGREAGNLDLVGHGPNLALGGLGLEQLGEHRDRRLEGWSALLCQGATVVGGWFLGTSLFPVWLPFGQVITSICAVIPMTLALMWIRFPMNWSGLLEAMATGGACYVVSVLVLNVAEVRTMLLSQLRKRMQPSVPALSD